MPNIQSQIKRDRQNKKRKEANQELRSSIKSATKRFNSLIEQKDADKAGEELRSLFKVLDKAAKKNIVHKNFVANKKSKAAKKLDSISKKKPAKAENKETEKD